MYHSSEFAFRPFFSVESHFCLLLQLSGTKTDLGAAKYQFSIENEQSDIYAVTVYCDD